MSDSPILNHRFGRDGSVSGTLERVDIGADDQGHYPVAILRTSTGRKAVSLTKPGAIKQLADAEPGFGDTLSIGPAQQLTVHKPDLYDGQEGTLRPPAGDYASIGAMGFRRQPNSSDYLVAPEAPEAAPVGEHWVEKKLPTGRLVRRFVPSTGFSTLPTTEID
jgi:hypothetical protein